MLKEMRGIERGLIGGFVPGSYKSKARATLIRRGDYAFEVDRRQAADAGRHRRARRSC